MPDSSKTQPDFSREEMIMPKTDGGVRLVAATKASKPVSKVFVVTALSLLVVIALVILGALFLPKIDWQQWFMKPAPDYLVAEVAPPLSAEVEVAEKDQDSEDLLKYSEATDLTAIATDLAATDFKNILREVNQIEREIKADLANGANSSPEPGPAPSTGSEE